MNRLEKFRQIRNVKKKMFILFFLSFLLLGIGICIVDYSTNFLMRNEKVINIVSLNKGDTYLDIKVMNKLIRFDMNKISNDIEYLVERLK